MSDTAWTVVQIILMLLACYACFIKGIDVGIVQAIDSLGEQGLLNQEKFDRKMREIEREEG